MRFPRTSRPTFLGPDIRSIYRGESWAAERARQRRLAPQAFVVGDTPRPCRLTR